MIVTSDLVNLSSLSEMSSQRKCHIALYDVISGLEKSDFPIGTDTPNKYDISHSLAVVGTRTVSRIRSTLFID